MAFLSDFEALLGTRAAVAALRAHPAYVELWDRWHARQLPVYFQIRFRELSTAVEDGLGRGDHARRPAPAGSAYCLAGTAAVADALVRCWHDDVVLYGLAYRFWRLSFQVRTGCATPRRRRAHRGGVQAQIWARYDDWAEQLSATAAGAVPPTADLLAALYLDAGTLRIQARCASLTEPHHSGGGV
jgi:hypothetical protein